MVETRLYLLDSLSLSFLRDIHFVSWSQIETTVLLAFSSLELFGDK